MVPQWGRTKLKVIAIPLAALLLALTAQAFGQQPGAPTTTPKRQPSASAKRSPADFRAEAAQVAEQLKVLSRFLYVYGRISNGLEVTGEQEKRGEASDSLLAKMKQSKTSVVADIQVLRTGLEKLEGTFHANRRLHLPYLKLLSASEAAAGAEQLAAGNHFDAAGRALVSVAERLADVLSQLSVR